MISVGIVTPHLAPGPEVELPAMAPGQIAVRVARIPARDAAAPSGGGPQPAGLRDRATLRTLAEAAAAFDPGSIDAVGYASTSSAYALGFDAESAMLAQLSQRLGVPTASTGESAVRALRMLDVARVALVHPPWFDDDLHESGAAYFTSQGFTVVSSAAADALPRDPRRIEPEAVVAWVEHHVPDSAEAIFIGGNGFRAAGAIDRLETPERAVLESNQVLLWSLLEAIDEPLVVDGCGRLLRRDGVN